MKTILELFGPREAGGDFGIEIEIEGANLPKRAFDVWAVKNEGSIKGEAFEYITKGPLKKENVPLAMENLNKVFNARESVVHDAYRAGVHIHRNVQKNTLYDIFGVIFAWTIVERVWMKLCGPTREKNLFCLPSTQSGHKIPFTARILEAAIPGQEGRFPAGAKYDAFNTDPIMSFGSIEFRTFPSSIKVEDIVKWVDWVDNLTTYGVSIDRDNLTKTWKGISEAPGAFLTAIFGKDYPEYHELVKQGCEDASDLSLVWAAHKVELKKIKQAPQGRNPNWMLVDDPLQAWADQMIRMRDEQNLEVRPLGRRPVV